MVGNEIVGAVNAQLFVYGIGNVQKHLIDSKAIEMFKSLQGKAITEIQPDEKKKLLTFGLRVGWPFLVPILTGISSTIADGASRKKFASELKTVQKSVNKRIAQSVFMRDFEFIHDKSSSEILNIVDKGKKSAIDLLWLTHTEIIPRFAVIGSAAVRNVKDNPLATALSLVRLPFLYAINKETAREMLVSRREELTRHDAIDTRINTFLGSIELVKTSDNMEKALEILQSDMEARDEEGLELKKKQVEREKHIDTFDKIFDIGVPAVIAGVQFLRRKGNIGNRAAGIGAFLSFSTISSAQQTSKETARELAQIYANSIQPAIQDIKRMEELLGPVDELDTPDGSAEQKRCGVDSLKTFDISVRDLQFKDILHGASLDIPKGTFVTIKGPSGSGKTTFLRHLMGLYGGDGGSVTYGGVPLADIKKFGDQSIYTTLAYANQNPQYFENMTLRENLLLWTRNAVTDERLKSILHDLNLDSLTGRLDTKVKHYSGGELRRIGIARALMKDPKILFLDEPTANLDEESARQVLAVIKRLRERRPDMTVVAVTHDENFEKIAERIIDFREINLS